MKTMQTNNRTINLLEIENVAHNSGYLLSSLLRSFENLPPAGKLELHSTLIRMLPAYIKSYNALMKNKGSLDSLYDELPVWLLKNNKDNIHKTLREKYFNE